MTPRELAEALERYECPCGPYPNLREAARALRDAEALAGAVDNALMFAHEDYGGAPSIRDTGAIEGLRTTLAAFRRGAGGER